MYVDERYRLSPELVEDLKRRPVRMGFGPVSEVTLYRTYSRKREGQTNEGWADIVVRCVEGCMSIRLDWYRKIGKRWPKAEMDKVAHAMADAIFDLKFVPPGRGLWTMGTEFIYGRGSAALNNCGFVSTANGRLSDSAAWAMDQLMMGVGVGFDTSWYQIPESARLLPRGDEVLTVADSREGWVRTTRAVIRAWEDGKPQPKLDYSKVRPAGSPIRGFGGTASGAGPLIKLHDTLAKELGKHDATRTVADVLNEVADCVVSGNVRRSAEIALGAPTDQTFLDLKNYSINPERESIGRFSNNSVVMAEPTDFELLPEVAKRVRSNGEPGVFNKLMTQKYGRAGDRMDDAAIGLNPCAEIPLEDRELCNLVEVFPTRHSSEADLQRTLQLATFYASTVALLRSHDESTNEVVARNRRIGVSMSGIADWVERDGVSAVFGMMNRGYETVRQANRELARGAGVPESVRVTTVKPSGTVSLLAGVSAGVHWPHAPHIIRRIRVGVNDPITPILQAAGVPHEPDVYSDDTEVYEFPLQTSGGRVRSIKDVPLLEQAALVAMTQRAWADNAVSNTLTFRSEDESQIEAVLSYYAPQVKSMSMLPHREDVYEQMPLETISADEYKARRAALSPLDWRGLERESSEPGRYCDADSCEVPGDN